MSETAPRLETGAALLCLAAAAALLSLPLANPDLFWHLSAGRWIADHAAVPRADWLSHTMAGSPWADFEWLPQLLYHAVAASGGLGSLWLLKALVLGAAGAVLWRALAAAGVGPLGRALGLLCCMLASPANDLRPENFSVLFFALLLGRLEAARRQGRTEARPGELARAAALFALWANIHAGFVYGLGLLGLYAAAAARRGRSARALALPAAAAGAALANPYGVRVYAVPWEHWTAIAHLQSYILEWQEASVLSPWLAPMWALMLLAFSSLAVSRLRAGSVPLEHLALVPALSWSAASHVRTAPYFAMASVVVLASAAGAAPAWARRALVWLGAAAALAFVAARYVPVLAQGAGGFDPVYVPVRAGEFLERERGAFAGKRLYNPWHWGGYLGWRLDGEAPVFFDGRYLFHQLLRPSYDAARSPEAYAAFLDAHRVEAAVVQRLAQFRPAVVTRADGSRETLARPFYLFFLPRERWALVHWDDKALVFVRRSAFDPAWAAAREYRWFRPDDLRAAALAAAEKEASFADLAAEANRWAETAERGEAEAARSWLADVARGP